METFAKYLAVAAGSALGGMVCAFITSAEYQLRFGTTATRTNALCGGNP